MAELGGAMKPTNGHARIGSNTKTSSRRWISVRMLLRHASGLFKTYRPQERVELALSMPPRFEPGTGWSYSAQPTD